MRRGVAISGKAGAGKNALASAISRLLVEEGEWPVEVSFAEALKQELLVFHGLTKEDPGGREKLVEIGQGRRDKDPDYWVKRLEHRIEELLPFGAIPIITDTRYRNELAFAQKSGFVTVRVDSSAVDRGYQLYLRGEDPAFCVSDHQSETDLDDAAFDVRFWNPHNNLGQLERAARYTVDLLLGQVDLLLDQVEADRSSDSLRVGLRA